MNELDKDRWFAQRIASLAHREPFEGIARAFAGDTDVKSRKERFRALILEWRVAEKRLGKFDGHDETVRQHFERRYHEPLTQSAAPEFSLCG